MIYQPPKSSDASESRTPYRRNDTSRLVREIKRRLHARSLASRLPATPYLHVYHHLLPLLLLSSPFILFIPFSSLCPPSVSTSTTQSRFSAVRQHEPRARRMFYAIGGHYRISSCPPLSHRRSCGPARARSCSRERDVSSLRGLASSRVRTCPYRQIPGTTICLPTVITCRPRTPRPGGTKIRQSPSITEN